MPLLSIIIPVYNKGKYLDTCVESIMAQTFKDFELILVNDGSTDDSGVKCDRYKNNNHNVDVFHQDNQGVSSARNKGIELATGEYIGFIDADDRIENNMYEILVSNALNTDADISICRLRQPNAKHARIKDCQDFKVLNQDEALLAFMKSELDFSANNKIYKKEIAKSIRFEGRMFEDVLYTFRAFSMSNKNVLVQNELYHYLLRDNSVSISKFSEKYLEPVFVTRKIVESLPAEKTQLVEQAKEFDLVMNISLLNLLVLSDKKRFLKEYQMVVNRLNEYTGFIKTSQVVKRKHRVAYKFFRLSAKLYALTLKLYFSIGVTLSGKRV